MKAASVALLITTTLLTSSQLEARDRLSKGPGVSPTILGLMASAQGCSAGCGTGVSLAIAPAIFGYGYHLTYYGNGFSYQPAYYPAQAYYVRPPLRGCCR